ncbi:MAG: glycosyltransferase, partial [Actinobacteria bacterium]|nr:glycosyltransferase [Actinomycetota bacterium]
LAGMAARPPARYAAMAAAPTVSVVVAAYSSARWQETRAALASVAAQTVPVLETVLVIDHNTELLSRARREFAGRQNAGDAGGAVVNVIPNVRDRGASGARNTGVAASHGDVVAFLDDDAVASPAWLEGLLGHFWDPAVVGAGGGVVPLWAGPAPRWFPPEFYWAVGASYRGMPEHAAEIRNVWSGNMAIRRPVFDSIGGFREGFGKVGNRPCPEDTDLCLRAAAGGGRWMYEPAALCGHRVPLQRATVRYFLSRSLNEGRGKAQLAGLEGTAQSTSAELRYARRVLPAGIARGLRDWIRGDVTGAARSLAIAAGLMLAVVGFVTGRAAGIKGRLERDPG